MPKYQLVVIADWNDGDYLEKSTIITKKDLNKLDPILKKIQKFKGESYNWTDLTENSDINILTEEDYEILSEYIPYGYPDDCGIHTIISIHLQEILSTKRLF